MKNQQINLLLIYICMFLAMGVFFPFHSIYLQETLGYSPNQISLIYSLSALMVIFSVPLAGMIADRFRNPGNIYIFCALATVAFLIPYSILRDFSIMLTLFILINGLRSCLIPLADTIGLDYTFKTKQNYGIYRAIGSFSFIAGAIIMGFMLDFFENAPNLFLYFQLVALILSTYFISKQENLYIDNSTKKISFSDVKSLFKNKLFILVANIMGLSYAIIQVSQNYLSLNIIELGGSNNIVGISFFFLAIPEVILFGFIVKMLKKRSHTYLMMVALVSLLLRWIILLTTNSIAILLVVSTTHGLIMALIILVGMDLLKRIVTPNLLSSAISLYTGIGNLYFSIITIFVGLMASETNYKDTYYIYALATILAIIILLWTIKYQKKGENKYEG